jgi:hypothetical protein
MWVVAPQKGKEIEFKVKQQRNCFGVFTSVSV